MIYFSASTNSFYTDDVHGINIPHDCVEITYELHMSLLNGLSSNCQEPPKKIAADKKGYPVLVDLPPLTNDQLISVAFDMRDSLLRDAANRIGPLQDAVDLDKATDEEIIRLKEWKNYRVDLNRIELQPNFPAELVWPQPPA